MTQRLSYAIITGFLFMGLMVNSFLRDRDYQGYISPNNQPAHAVSAGLEIRVADLDEDGFQETSIEDNGKVYPLPEADKGKDYSLKSGSRMANMIGRNGLSRKY